MAVEKSKAFDYAQDVTKQLITLSTGVVTITVAFLGNVAPDAPRDARTALYIAWGLFALAIVAGIATLLNLTGRVGGADHSTDGITAPAIRLFSVLQIILFVAAIGATIYFGARAFHALPANCKQTVTKTVTGPGDTKTERSCPSS